MWFRPCTCGQHLAAVEEDEESEDEGVKLHSISGK